MPLPSVPIGNRVRLRVLSTNPDSGLPEDPPTPLVCTVTYRETGENELPEVYHQEPGVWFAYSHPQRAGIYDVQFEEPPSGGGVALSRVVGAFLVTP